MALCLVVHDLQGVSAEAEHAFFHAIFEIAPDHWRMSGGAVLVGTEVSPGYLRDHLVRALARRGGAPHLLLVTRVPPDLATHGLPPDGAAWLAEVQG